MIRTTAHFLLFIGLIISSCSSNPLNIDNSKVQVSIHFTQLDSLLQHTEQKNWQAALLDAHANIPEVIDYQLGYCLRLGRVSDSTLASGLIQFYGDPYLIQLEGELKKRFNSTKKHSTQITEGFRYLKAHLPTIKIPKDIVYLNSFFSGSAFCTENAIAIGLERYLGKDSPSIKSLPSEEFYDWTKIAMDERYLDRDAITSWIYTHIIPETKESSLVASMVNWGKIIYLTQAAFPTSEPSIPMRYSTTEFEWAVAHERVIWEYLVKNQLLFTKSERELANWLKEGPFTPGLPEKGPDRLGQFIGFRIIQSYMEQNSITLEELIQLPYNELLQAYEIQ